MINAGAIDFSRFRLVKCHVKGATVIVEFEAPRMGAHVYEPIIIKSTIDYAQPHPDFFEAWKKVRPIILRIFDWQPHIVNQIVVTGIQVENQFDEAFEVSFRFVFMSSKIDGEIELTKTIPLTSISGLNRSLTEKELDDVATLIDEIQAYISREKLAQGDLFKDKSVAVVTTN